MKQIDLLPFKITASKKSSTKITSFGGVPLVVEAYRVMRLCEVVEENMCFKARGWSENKLMEELISLQVAGGECMDDVDYFKADDCSVLFGYGGMPSAVAVRRFLHLFDEGVSEPRGLGEAYVPEENFFLKALGCVNRELVRKLIKRENPSHITLDVDATVARSYKRNALETYKGGTGYQPIIGIWAEKQLVIEDQFRDGNVNAAAHALGFLKRCEANIPRGRQSKRIKLRIRSDGAWYQHEVMEYCMKQGYEFSISADVRCGLKRWIEKIPEEEWKSLHKITANGKERTDKEYAALSFTTASLSQAGMKQRVRDYHYVMIRTKRTQYDLMEGPYHYDAIVTNMSWDPQRQIWWHYERCGSVENVIDMLKNDLAGGKFPCGTFGANAAWWRITCITHNLIQALKMIALPLEWFYVRMKTLRFRLFCIAGRIIRHARQTILQLPRGSPIIPIYNEARQKLAAIA